jgi:hypothetical protein
VKDGKQYRFLSSLKIGATKKDLYSDESPTFNDTRILNVHGTKSY